MDKKKVIKDFIVDVCESVYEAYRYVGHDSCRHNIPSEFYYLVRDKGVEKRIRQRLYKKYGLTSRVYFDYSNYIGRDINLNIKVIVNEVHVPKIIAPRLIKPFTNKPDTEAWWL